MNRGKMLPRENAYENEQSAASNRLLMKAL
jgi:hypothetical protein